MILFFLVFLVYLLQLQPSSCQEDPTKDFRPEAVPPPHTVQTPINQTFQDQFLGRFSIEMKRRKPTGPVKINPNDL